MAQITKVLSLDGGGIRGVIPALILAEIEKRKGKPIAELFDLIAGTSTGGILALALTKPDPSGKPEWRAEKLVALYEQEGTTIFSRSLWRRLYTLEGMLEETYSAAGLEQVLRNYLGESRLKEACTDILVPAYEIERRFPWFFRSARAKADPDYDFPMWEVARATSAAPTFFEPARIKPEAGPPESPPAHWALIDGGVFANNPAMCAYVEARQSSDPLSILLVSLGTGQLTRAIPYEEARGWGWAQWARPAISSVMDGVQDAVEYQLKLVLPEANYFRFQVGLEVGYDDMDDASKTNIAALRSLAEKLIEARSDEIDRLCSLL